jgi:DNA polymerase-3 subunit gamma/tau
MRLYRFADLVGNQVTISLLKRALVNRSLKNFVIMSGIMGTGKSTSAEIVGLYLTCESPGVGEPCLKCNTCITNIKALQTTGTSRNLVKKNIGRLKDRKDLEDLIKEIFILQGAVGNNVYILEEVHELPHSHQTPLLEEIDRLGDNTFVILCTTRPHRLLPELRSRAFPYNFNRLNKNESKLLFDRTVSKLGIKRASKEVETMITKYAKGVPRDMVKIIEFVKNDSPTEEELRTFLGFISNEVFVELFNSMKHSMAETANTVENILNSNSLDTVITQLKEFMVNCIFLIESAITEEFSRTESNSIKEMFNEDLCYKIANIVEKLDPFNYSEADFKLAVIKLRNAMVGRNAVSILAGSKSAASEQTHKAKALFVEEERIKQETAEGHVNLLTREKMNEFSKEN